MAIRGMLERKDYPKFENKVRRNLIKMRVMFKLSQRELAHALDIHPSTYGKMERGQRAIQLWLIVILADFYACSTDELLCRTRRKR